MQQLEMLIISRKLGVPLERLTRALPNTEIRYVRWVSICAERGL